MDILLGIVHAHATARDLATAAAWSVMAVDDCGHLVELCTKALPPALAALDSSATVLDDEAAARAFGVVQALTLAMATTRLALVRLGEHASEGLLQTILEAPTCWLDLYRGFRGITVQLSALATVLRAALPPPEAADANASLQASLHAFTAVCARARDAAQLIGSELPEFARAAAAAGWTPQELRLALAAGSTPLATRTSSGCSCDSSSELSGPVSQPTRVASFSLPAAAASPSPSSPGARWRLLGLLGRAARRASGQQQQQQQQQTLADPAVSPDASVAGAGVGACLERAAVSIAQRVQQSILYDSEEDQLEQDRAYLLERVTLLREHHATCSAAASDASGGACADDSAAAHAAAAAASLVQSEVLLAAVEARLRAMREEEELSLLHRRQQRQCTADSAAAAVTVTVTYTGAGKAAAASPDACKGSREGKLHHRAASGADAAFCDDDDAVPQKRLSGALSWLPMCFVGA